MTLYEKRTGAGSAIYSLAPRTGFRPSKEIEAIQQLIKNSLIKLTVSRVVKRKGHIYEEDYNGKKTLIA